METSVQETVCESAGGETNREEDKGWKSREMIAKLIRGEIEVSLPAVIPMESGLWGKKPSRVEGFGFCVRS